MNTTQQGFFEFEVKGNYIDGRFVIPKDKQGEWKATNPGNFLDHSGVFHYGYAAVDEAVEAARNAFKLWSQKPFSERAQLLQRYKEELKKREPQLAQMISREVGKPLWEAKQEVATMINKVDISLTDGMKPVTRYEIPQILENTVGVCDYRPHGVFVVIGPFNFPGHLANGHIVPALATGNTVIFKPSEKSPGVGQLMAECFHSAGFPPGVFNVVQGEKEVGRRLSVHEGIDGVLFTGSYEVGLKIKQDTLQHYWKLVALELGGKNATIICDDAHLDWAVYETLTSAFITTGQRCSATSRVLVDNKLLGAFLEKFHQQAKRFRIGYAFDEPAPFMGPLVDHLAVEKYLKFVGIASREGAEVVMRGRPFEVAGRKGHYVTPSICLVKDTDLNSVKKSVYQQTEIFGPNVAVYGYESLDQACALANATPFGLAFSVFTKERATFAQASLQLRAGLINWNRSTVGASSKLPFGGLKKSGNHFPTAVTASAYCAYPVASLEVAEPKMPSALLPGLAAL